MTTLTTRTRYLAVSGLTLLLLIFVVGAAAAAVAPPVVQSPVFVASAAPVVAVNAGGSVYTDSTGIVWQADKPYAPGSWGFVLGQSYSTTVRIEQTGDQPLYQTERWNMAAYRFDLPNGVYAVELHFAEIYPWTCPGDRIFDVQLEGATVLKDLNIMAAVGPYMPLVRAFTTTVNDGRLDVGFPAAFPPGKVSAILVRLHDGGTPTHTRTATSTRTATGTRTPTRTGTMPPGGLPTATPPAVYEVGVNAGGAAYTDIRGRAWAADQAYAPGSWGYIGGDSFAFNHDIANTDDPQLYQSTRWGMSEYRFDLPNGAYRVELKFAEILTQSCPGGRIFDVSLGATRVIAGLDLVDRSGRYTARDFSFTTEITAGQLSIVFSGTVDAPTINALRVESIARGPTPTPTQTPTITSTPTHTNTPIPPYDMRVNAGGMQWLDPYGNIWQGDRTYSGNTWGWIGGSTYATAQPIGNTDLDKIYQSERFWSTNGGYAFDVANGPYRVELKFAEVYYSSVGARRFNVSIEGQSVLSGFDVVAAAGGRYIAVDRVFTVTVTDNHLNVDVQVGVDAAKINALRVTLLGGATPTATASATATATDTPPTPTGTASTTATASPTQTIPPLATSTFTPSPTQTAMPTPLYEVRVNAGNGVYTDTLGAVWQADRAYAAGPWGAVGGQVYTVANAIDGTTEDKLYQSERWGMTEYRFDAPNGQYQVEMRFAEIYDSGVGRRVFDVLIEGAPALYRLDVFAAAAGKYKAHDRQFNTAVTDGQLNIAFVSVSSAAKLSALRVTLLQPPTPTHTATATTTATRTATLTATPSPTPIYDRRVNVAGGEYTDSSGKVWMLDTAYVAGSWGYVGGLTSTVGNPIGNTDDDVLYQSERYWPSGGSYKFDVANGTYRVELKFAEAYYNSPGYRRFNVAIEGTPALTNFDAWLAAGGKFKAVDRVFLIDVLDGQLNVDFTVGIDAPTLTAIRVTRQ